jgi:hypothetical protein
LPCYIYLVFYAYQGYRVKAWTRKGNFNLSNKIEEVGA